MPLATQPVPGTLVQICRAQGWDPDNPPMLPSGCVTPPRAYRVPRCQINVVPAGPVPAAAAARLGVPSSAQRFRASLTLATPADPGLNVALYLNTGVYETNYTFDFENYAEINDPTIQLGGFLTRWTGPTQPRVFVIMPAKLAPANAAAEKEHCTDFIRAYDLTLGAVSRAMQALAGVAVEGSLSIVEARQAMERRLAESLPPALRAIACDPVRLESKFKALVDMSRDGRDVMRYHSFGMVRVEAAPPLPMVYMDGAPRPAKGRVYLQYTAGSTQIGVHPSERVIHL